MSADGTVPSGREAGGETPPEKIVIGDFGALGDTSLWTVYWLATTGEIWARQKSAPSRRHSRGRPDRLLGRLPTLDYASEIIRLIRQSRRSPTWEKASGIDDLARWIRMVMAALNHEPRGLANIINEENRAYYLDFGHTRHRVDRSTTELTARELWDDLDRTAAHATHVLNDLVETLNADGNLAHAATTAQELVELAIGIYLALGNAYRVAHQQLPGPQTA